MTWVKSSLIFSVLVLSLFLGDYLKPTLQPKDPKDRVNFEELIPKEFGEWRVIEGQLMVIADPEVEGVLNRIYSQTVSRTYVDAQGNRVMLSLAYGESQSDSMQIHKPEVCYPAQGFVVLENKKSYLNTGFNLVPVRKLTTTLGNRKEFVLYWILVGDQVVGGGLERKIQQLSYGLKGVIPAGLLFRVSLIGDDEVIAFSEQERFVLDLLNALDKKMVHHLVGKFSN